MNGYDTDTWTWDTEEVERWISNTAELYASCQGQSAAGLHAIVRSFALRNHHIDVDLAHVQWKQLAQFFGADLELAPDAHLDDVGD